MTDNELLQIYINLAPFLASVCGPGSEITVHDVAHPEHSLIAIQNGISGRQVGNPLTNLAQKIIDQGSYKTSDYLVNYPGHNQAGDFLSSTYYIKNEGRLIGLMCINKDMSGVQGLHLAVQNLLEQFNLAAPQEAEISECLDNPVTEIMHTRIADMIAQTGVPPARMSSQEKIRVVHRLNEDGILMMKGAVAEIAAQLLVSVPTVYRYLNKKG